jgi:hypothetical protein
MIDVRPIVNPYEILLFPDTATSGESGPFQFYLVGHRESVVVNCVRLPPVGEPLP